MIKTCNTCKEEWETEEGYVTFHICKGDAASQAKYKDFIVGEIVETPHELEPPC